MSKQKLNFLSLISLLCGAFNGITLTKITLQIGIQGYNATTYQFLAFRQQSTTAWWAYSSVMSYFNNNKTEYLFSMHATSRRQHYLPDGLFSFRCAVIISSWLGHLRRLELVDADPCSTNGIAKYCCFTPAAQYAALGSSLHVSAAHRHFGS